MIEHMIRNYAKNLKDNEYVELKKTVLNIIDEEDKKRFKK